MDLLADRIDKALFDLMFSDFDSLQEEYHDKLKQVFECNTKEKLP